MANFGFILTHKCNWKCEYCEFPLLKNTHQTSIEIISKHIDYINKILYKLDINNLLGFISVDGGELGTMDLDTLQYFFSVLGRKVVISTNGTFLKNGYHEDPVIKSFLKEIWYHVDITGVEKYDGVVYGIVHNDIDELVDFIKANEHTRFDYVELEYDIRKPQDVDYKQYEGFYNQIKDIKNISNGAKQNIKMRISEQHDMRQRCFEFNTTTVIDLVSETIPLCQRATRSFIKLSEEDLIKRLTTFPKDLYSPHWCNSCTRLFRGKHLSSNVEDYFKARRIL